MSLHEVGVNVHDAYGAGASAEEYASAFHGLHDDSSDVLMFSKFTSYVIDFLFGFGGRMFFAGEFTQYP